MNNFGDVAIAAALIPAGEITETTTGAAFDLKDFAGEAVVILSAAADGVGTVNVKLTHSATADGTYTDVAGAAFDEVEDAASHQKLSIDTDEMKRFVKAVATVAGVDAAQVISVSIVGIPDTL